MTAHLPSFCNHRTTRRVKDMNLPPTALEELRRICAESFQRQLTDAELQELGQRILRFLRNSDEGGDVGAF